MASVDTLSLFGARPLGLSRFGRNSSGFPEIFPDRHEYPAYTDNPYCRFIWQNQHHFRNTHQQL
jgi:hypothetical protein